MSLGKRTTTRLALPVGLASAVVVLPFLAAGSCSSSPGNATSGSDAASLTDHVINYGSDGAAVPDGDGSSTDMSPIPNFTSGWSHVPWAPDCALYQPPVGDFSSIPVPTWTACSSGRAGCTQLVRDWSTRADATIPIVSERSSGPSSVETFMVREYSPNQLEYLAWDTAKGIEGAWRFNGTGNECVEVLGNIAAGQIGLTEAVFGGNPTVQQYRQVFGSASEILAKSTPDYVFQPSDIGFPSILMQESSASTTVSSLYLGETDQLAVRDRVGGAVTLLRADGGTSLEADPFSSIVGDNIFFSSTSGLFAWGRSTGAQMLLASSLSTLEHDLTTDGSGLAWIESTNPDVNGFYTSAVVFTSPLATSAAGVSPHATVTVACKDSLCGAAMNQGYVTVGMDPDGAAQRLLLLRLSDSAHWTLADNPALERWGLGKVVNNELWIPSQIYGNNVSVERISLGSIGAPDTD